MYCAHLRNERILATCSNGMYLYYNNTYNIGMSIIHIIGIRVHYTLGGQTKHIASRSNDEGFIMLYFFSIVVGFYF